DSRIQLVERTEDKNDWWTGRLNGVEIMFKNFKQSKQISGVLEHIDNDYQLKTAAIIKNRNS
ncbi:13324_t:CDS:2, partial [Ambispora gerdemannii]